MYLLSQKVPNSNLNFQLRIGANFLLTLFFDNFNFDTLSFIVCTKFPSSRLIFGQKSYFLGTTIYEIPKTKITLLSTGILTYLSNLDKISRPMKDEIQNSRG